MYISTGLEISTRLLVNGEWKLWWGLVCPPGHLAEQARSSDRICHWHWEPSDCSIAERSESKERSVCCALFIGSSGGFRGEERALNSMCICVCVCVCLCMHIHVSVCMYMCVSVHVSACMYMYVCVHVSVCVCT
ncbi:unnamed protein product, partial [Staurois parvus]